MANKQTVLNLRDRMVAQSLRDLWWLARNGITYRSPMSLQAVESTIKKNPQGVYQICHVRDDGDRADSWSQIELPASRVIESRGNTSVFRARAPAPNAHERTPEARAAAERPPEPSASHAPFGNLAKDSSVQTPGPTEEIGPQIKRLERKVDRLQDTVDELSEKLDAFFNADGLLDRMKRQQEFLRQAEDHFTQEAASLEGERAELDQLREEITTLKDRQKTA